MLTRSLCRDEPLTVLRAAILGGVDLVQVREKPFGDDAVAWIGAVQEVCAEYTVPVVVNDRLDLMRATGAPGVHLGQEDLSRHPPRSLRERSFALGISTHGPAELDRAMLEAPDYVGVGPCFATATKGYGEGLSLAQLRELVEQARVPAFAIGGIDAQNVHRLRRLGVERVAVSRAILQAADPRAAARGLASSLGRFPRC